MVGLDEELEIVHTQLDHLVDEHLVICLTPSDVLQVIGERLKSAAGEGRLPYAAGRRHRQIVHWWGQDVLRQHECRAQHFYESVDGIERADIRAPGEGNGGPALQLAGVYDEPFFIELCGVVDAVESVSCQRVILWLAYKNHRLFASGQRFGRLDDVEPDFGQFFDVALELTGGEAVAVASTLTKHYLSRG